MALNNLWFLTECFKSVNKLRQLNAGRESTYNSEQKLPRRSRRERERPTFSWLKSSKTAEVKVPVDGCPVCPHLDPHTGKNGVQAPSASFYSGRCVLVKPVCQETQQAGAQVKIPKEHEHNRREVSLLITSWRKVTVKPKSQRCRDVTLICLLVTDWGGARESAHLISVMTIFGLAVSTLFTRLVFFYFSSFLKKT